MKLLFRLSLPLFCLAHTMAFSQKATAPEQKSAIHFEDSLSWKAILEKAKKENKYIFLDCFTTWCGPCKQLEKEVYVVDSVGKLFNDHFISVKMQIDKKKTDPEAIKARYQDAAYIDKTFQIEAYPTLIFFNPDGEVVNRVEGYMDAGNLLSTARTAMLPGRIFKDPVAELKQSLKLYREKGATLENLKQLIDKATVLRKTNIADSLGKVYMALLRKQRPSDLYRKDILLTIANSKLEKDDPLLKLFYPDGHKADAIAGEGISKFVVDRYIKNIYFDQAKFFKKEIPDTKWDSIRQVISKRFSEEWSTRAIAAAKVQWYILKRDTVYLPQQAISLIENHGMESLLAYDYFLGFVSDFKDTKQSKALIVNIICWNFVFASKGDTHLLDRGIEFMKTVVQQGEDDSAAWWNPYTFDTYANLIYRRGRVKEAIEYEQKALDIMKSKVNHYATEEIVATEEVLKKMKAGIPTWRI